jgi:hypothetical protein
MTLTLAGLICFILAMVFNNVGLAALGIVFCSAGV